jgi:3-oxoacyl-[acyl-carrier-protein] synthase-3
MKGNELFRVAVRLMVQAAKKSLKNADLSPADVDLFVPHQANIRIINAAAKRLQLPLDKIYLNIVRYGNMSSASSAVALCEAWEEGKINNGDIIVIDTFGAGLVWGSCVIKWI